MPSPLEIQYRFPGNPKLSGCGVEVPETATVQDFKNQIRGKYLRLNLGHYSVIYNRQLQEDSKKFSAFWSEDLNKDVLLVPTSVEVNFQWSDHPQFGVDTVDILTTWTIEDFKNAIKDQYPTVNLNQYCVIYNGAMQGNSKKFWEFWSEDPVREVHLVSQSIAGLSLN